MKKSNIFKSILATSAIIALPLIIINHDSNGKNNIKNESLKEQKSQFKSLKNAEQILVTNVDILKSWSFVQIRDLMETIVITQEILDKLSITMPILSDPAKVSFTNIKNELFKITFTINYNGVAKSTPDFLNTTPTDSEIVNLSYIENVDSLIHNDTAFIKDLLETPLMNQGILNQATIIIPEGADPAKVSFTNINIDNPLRVSFNMNYNGVEKTTANFLNATATDLEVVNKISIDNQDILKHLDVVTIRGILESSPMTTEILKQLSITIPEGTNASLVSFTEINISNPFMVTFVINYNGTPKPSSDFLNAILTDKQTAERSVIQNVDILNDQNINNIKSMLETKPMTREILEKISLKLPQGSEPKHFSFTDIDTVNPFKITFIINYKGVPKSTTDSLTAKPTDKETVESIFVVNQDILKDKNINYIKGLLETRVMTQKILDQLSISLPEGGDVSKVTFTNIDLSDLYAISFRINYNKVSKDVLDFLSATPTDLEVALAATLTNQDILKAETVNFIKTVLESPTMTQEILSQLSINAPKGSLPELFSFTDIDISNPFKILFKINYNGVAKDTVEFLNATPTDAEISRTILITNNEIMNNKKVIEIRDILETRVITKEILDSLSITLAEGVDPSLVTFSDINIDNPLRVTFTINYNRVPKSAPDFLFAQASDAEIVDAITITNVDALKDFTGIKIRNLLETSPMTMEILDQLTIKFPLGADVTKLSFTKISITNLFKVTFTISYNSVVKKEFDFLNTTPTNLEVANKITVSNTNILKSQNALFIKGLLEVSPMTLANLQKLSIIFPEGADIAKITFTDINITNPLRVTFKINYSGVAKSSNNFLNATPDDQEVVNSIILTNPDAVSNLGVDKIRDLLETKPMTQAVLTKLSIEVPAGTEIFRVSFQNIVITNLFRVSFTITYNGVAKATGDILNSTPLNQDIANSSLVLDKNILMNKDVSFIKRLLDTKPMTIEILTQLSITIPDGSAADKISFTKINIKNPLRITFTINYNGVPKETSDFLLAQATDLEVVSIISVKNKDILRLENGAFVKKLLDTAPTTMEILNQLSIEIPEGADLSKISFTDVNIDDTLKVTFTINYNEVPKPTKDLLNVTPTQDIANVIIIEDVNILKNETVDYIKGLLETNPMTKEILNELSITLPKGVGPERITFTNIDTTDLFKITFNMNYNGVASEKDTFFNTTPLDKDIANAIIIQNFDIFKDQELLFVQTLLETNPMTMEILTQLSITIPAGIDVAKITFTDIDITNPAMITFKINYNGVSGDKAFSFNIKAPYSNTILIVSTVVPIGILLIVAALATAFIIRKRNGGSFDFSKKPETEIPQNEVKKPVKPVENKNKYQEYTNEIFSNPANSLSNNNGGENFGFNNQNQGQVLFPNQSLNNEKYSNDQFDQNGQYQDQGQYDQNGYYDQNGQWVQNDDKWSDNKWYGDQSETGQWDNGQWFDNENYDENGQYIGNPQDSPDEEWDDMIDMIEK